jgi:hypothetical protein
MFATELSRCDMSTSNLEGQGSLINSVLCDTLTPWGMDDNECPEEDVDFGS